MNKLNNKYEARIRNFVYEVCKLLQILFNLLTIS